MYSAPIELVPGPIIPVLRTHPENPLVLLVNFLRGCRTIFIMILGLVMMPEIAMTLVLVLVSVRTV